MKSGRLRRALRRDLVAGLIVIAPVGVTAFVLLWIFEWLDGLLGRFLYPAIGVAVPGLGLLALFVLLILVGWAAQRAVGARVLAWWHAVLERIPLTSRVYSASSRIIRTVFEESPTRPFQEVVLVEYPADGRWAVGFVTAPAPEMVRAAVGDAVTVFIPTTPNPTSGFLIIVPRSKIVPLAMTTEQAFTFILSAGAVRPELEPAPVEGARA